MSIFFLLTMASGILLMPACGSSSKTSSNPSGQVTPANTYTFTLTGADENGAAPGSTTTCTTGVACTAAATVSLVVN